MKTVLIWNEFELGIRFAVVEDDWTRFNGVYVNSTQAQCAELTDLVFDDQGDYKIAFQPEFPVQAVKDGAQVIICGFIP